MRCGLRWRRELFFLFSLFLPFSIFHFVWKKVTAKILFRLSAIQICKSETKGVYLHLKANQYTQELEHMRSLEIFVYGNDFIYSCGLFASFGSQSQGAIITDATWYNLSILPWSNGSKDEYNPFCLVIFIISDATESLN